MYRAFLDPNRLMRHGAFNVSSEAYAVQERLLTAFVDSVRSEGARATVLVFPSRREITTGRAGGRPSYAPLSSALRGEGVHVIDPLPMLVSSGIPSDELFAPFDHYAERGNALLAEVVAAALRLRSR